MSKSHSNATDWDWLNLLLSTAFQIGEIVIDDFTTIKRRRIDKNEVTLQNNSGSNGWLAGNIVKNLVQSIDRSLENLSALKVDVITELNHRYCKSECDGVIGVGRNYSAVCTPGKSSTFRSEQITGTVVGKPNGPDVEFKAIENDQLCEEHNDENTEKLDKQLDGFSNEDRFPPVSAEQINGETVNKKVATSSTSISDNTPQQSSVSAKQKTSCTNLTDSSDKNRVLASDSSDEYFIPTSSSQKPNTTPKNVDDKLREDTLQNNLNQTSRKRSIYSTTEEEDNVTLARRLSQKPKAEDRRKKVTQTRTQNQKGDAKLNKTTKVVMEKLDRELEMELEQYGFVRIEDSAVDESHSSEEDKRITRAMKSTEKDVPKVRTRTDRECKNFVIYDISNSDDSTCDKTYSPKVNNSKAPKRRSRNDESSSSGTSSTDDETAKSNVLRDSDDEKVKDLKGPKSKKYYMPRVCYLLSSSDDETSQSLKKTKTERKSKSTRKDNENSNDDIAIALRRVVKKRKVLSESSSNDNASKKDIPDSDLFLDTKEANKKTKIQKDVSFDNKPGNKKQRCHHSDDSNNSNYKKTSGMDDVQKEQGDEPSSTEKEHIQQVFSKEDLENSARLAEKEENERREKSVLEKQQLYNGFQPSLPECDKITSIVLDFNRTTNEPTVSVNPSIAGKLKPYQADGVKFLYDRTIENIENENSGSGCIMANWKGLGRKLSSIAFLHSVLTNEKTNIKTALIVCPLNAVGNWFNEFSLWLNDVNNRVNIHKLWEHSTSVGLEDALVDFKTRGGVGIIHDTPFLHLSSHQSSSTSWNNDKIYKNLLDPGADVVICDEVLLKNSNCGLPVSFSKIRTRRRIFISGKPLYTNLYKYHAMMSFVKPNLLGTLEEFTRRFINPMNKGQKADSDENAVNLMKKRAHVLKRLLDGCNQNVNHNILIPYLPPKHEYLLVIKMTPKQEALYKHFSENFKSMLSQPSLLKMLRKNYYSLQKIWNHPIVLTYKTSKRRDYSDPDESNYSSSDETTSSSCDTSSQVESTDTQNEKLNKDKLEAKEKPKEVVENPAENQVSGKLPTDRYMRFFESKEDLKNVELSGKLVTLMEILKICDSIEDKLLVCCQYRSSLDMIEEFLAKWNQQTQENANTSRAEFPLNSRWRKNVEYFRLERNSGSWENQRDEFNSELTGAKLFLVSTRAGDLNMNLVSANRVVFFDAFLNYFHDMQNVSRVFRFGQTKPCYIYRLVAEGTMEEKIYRRQVALSSSGRIMNEPQIERHFKIEEINTLYSYEDPAEKVDRPIPQVPKDRLLSELLLAQKKNITIYPQQTTFLGTKMDEGLTDEERNAAWDEYNSERKARVSQHTQQQLSQDDLNTYQKIWRILQQRHNDFDPDKLTEWSDKIMLQILRLQQLLKVFNIHRTKMSAEEVRVAQSNIDKICQWVTTVLGSSTTNTTPAASTSGSSSGSQLQPQSQTSRTQNITMPEQPSSSSATRTPTATVVQTNRVEPYPVINVASNILNTSTESSPEPRVRSVRTGSWTNVVPYEYNKPNSHKK